MLKPIGRPCPIPFERKSIIKTEWLNGNIPLEKGFFGGKLDPENISLDHMQPKSKGGASNLGNYVITTAKNNGLKGDGDIFQYATKENTEAYFKVFENCNIGNIKGADYLALISKTLRRLWKNSPLVQKDDMWEVLKRY